MFITEEEAIKRLNDKRNLFSPNYEVPERYDDSTEPRPTNDKIDEILDIVEEPDPYKISQRTGSLKGQHDVQIAIGTTSALIGPGKTGNLYNLDANQVSAYKHGYSDLEDRAKGINRVPRRLDAMNKVKDTLADLASQKLEVALNNLTNEKIQDCSATKVSGIARDMATVMDRVTRDNKNPEHIHFHVFKPEMKSIGEYSTVKVSSPLVIKPQDL